MHRKRAVVRTVAVVAAAAALGAATQLVPTAHIVGRASAGTTVQLESCSAGAPHTIGDLGRLWPSPERDPASSDDGAYRPFTGCSVVASVRADDRGHYGFLVLPGDYVLAGPSCLGSVGGPGMWANAVSVHLFGTADVARFLGVQDACG